MRNDQAKGDARGPSQTTPADDCTPSVCKGLWALPSAIGFGCNKKQKQKQQKKTSDQTCGYNMEKQNPSPQPELAPYLSSFLSDTSWPSGRPPCRAVPRPSEACWAGHTASDWVSQGRGILHNFCRVVPVLHLW